MIKRILVLPDVHITQDGCSKSYQLVKELIKDYKPHKIIILGDFMDCTSLSHWLEDKRECLENKRYKKECDVANQELDYLQKYCKDIVYCEGNHENWVIQYVEHNPEVKGLLEIPIMLNLDKRGIKWVELNQLYKCGKAYFTHGFVATKYHAMKMLLSYGCCIVYGHSHNAQTAQMNMKMQDPIMSYGLGCLCSHEPYYLHRRPCNWIDQFAIMEMNERGNFNILPINITNNQFIHNGVEYNGKNIPK